MGILMRPFVVICAVKVLIAFVAYKSSTLQIKDNPPTMT